MRLLKRLRFITCFSFAVVLAVGARGETRDPLFEEFLQCIALEAPSIEPLVPSILEVATLMIDYVCSKESAAWTVDFLENVNTETIPPSGSDEWFDEVDEVQNLFLSGKVIEELISLRKSRLSRE